MKNRTPLVLALCACVLAVPATAGASDKTLVDTFVKWATKFGADADKQSKVSNAHGATAKQVKAATEVVRQDALHAKRAMLAEHPSTAKGKQVQSLSVQSYSTYATAEKELELGIDASVRGNRAAANAHTAQAEKLVGKAGKLLQQAGTLADQL
jgi:predicted RNA-binding protein Jag